MAFVLDASVALSWCFRDESGGCSERILRLAAEGERIFVPANWPMEVLNGLVRARRRGRLDDAALEQFLASVLAYDIVVETRPPAGQWADARPLAFQHSLSAYDAGYLALAKRLGTSLATMDEQLRLAAEHEGVVLEV